MSPTPKVGAKVSANSVAKQGSANSLVRKGSSSSVAKQGSVVKVTANKVIDVAHTTVKGSKMSLLPKTLSKQGSPLAKLSPLTLKTTTNKVPVNKTSHSSGKSLPVSENSRAKFSLIDHKLTPEVVARKYNTNIERGLSSGAAKELLARNDFNQLTPPKRTSELVKFLKLLTGGFSLLLWVGAILCIVAFCIDKFVNHIDVYDNLYLGTALVVVVMITGAFAYYQEAKSCAIMESFKDLIPQTASVLRDGQMIEVEAKNLVIGDIVEVAGGNKIPADILLIDASGFKVDNSSITGESEPQQRSTHCSSQNALETENLAFFSTYATEGKARGIVIRTGDRTLIGKIAQLTTQLQQSETTIAIELKKFIHIVTIFACVLGAVFFALAMAMGYNFMQALVFFIGILVANVPEGILATVTVSLTLTAKSLSAKNCLVKNLEAVETLGSTSVICSDKTGTLTQNKMRVAHLWFDNEMVEIGELESNKHNAKLIELAANKVNKFQDFLRVCCLNNKASFKQQQQQQHQAEAVSSVGRRECVGNASEIALFKFLESININCQRMRKMLPMVDEIPFNSTNKFHLTVHSTERYKFDKKFLFCLKGAPERILEGCSSLLLDGKSKELTSATRDQINDICQLLASKGERVLGFAECYSDSKQIKKEADGSIKLAHISPFTFLGIMSMVDPPRPEVPNAVETCRSAGIKVVMVTGDHPVTARAIAESVSIITVRKKDIVVADAKFIRNMDIKVVPGAAKRAIVVSGDVLAKLSDAQLDYIVGNYKEIVFARTSPQQKLAIVQSFQRQGAIVAVTGDGVNDSPALKRANIGIAMGITGSDVAKGAADMILMDDNFATIIVGIEEGRVIFDNLKKSIAYTLASNFAEIMPFLVYVVFGFPLALSTIAILCVDLGTDIAPSIAFAYEKAESDVMKQAPRNSKVDHLVTAKMFQTAYFQIGMIQVAAGYFTYFVVMAQYGFHVGDLLGIRSRWENKTIVIHDNRQRPWPYEDRKMLEIKCQSAFFVAIIVCQIADAIISKTRRNSIITQRMDNTVLNYSILFELVIGFLLIYCPGLSASLGFSTLPWYVWLCAVPFAIYIIVYDEVRRYFIRLSHGGFFEKETYY